MHIPSRHLEVKTSTLPGSGLGLFTKVDIPKDSYIVEYKGRVVRWDDVKDDAENAYLYYVSNDCVIDARPYKKALARYANDARGITKVKGVNNNAAYERSNGKVYIKAVRHIPAGSEILVSYGKEYWDTHRENARIELRRQKEERKKGAGSRKKNV